MHPSANSRAGLMSNEQRRAHLITLPKPTFQLREKTRRIETLRA